MHKQINTKLNAITSIKINNFENQKKLIIFELKYLAKSGKLIIIVYQKENKFHFKITAKFHFFQ